VLAVRARRVHAEQHGRGARGWGVPRDAEASVLCTSSQSGQLAIETREEGGSAPMSVRA
jgi:hypothetical protein